MYLLAQAEKIWRPHSERLLRNSGIHPQKKAGQTRLFSFLAEVDFHRNPCEIIVLSHLIFDIAIIGFFHILRQVAEKYKLRIIEM